MGKKETLQDPGYNPVSNRGGLTKREMAQFYENMVLNDEAYINASEEDKRVRLGNHFDKFIAPIEVEEGRDPMQVQMAKDKYLAEKFPPPPTTVDPFPIPSFEDYMPEEPVPPMDWPKDQKVKTEAQREVEAAEAPEVDTTDLTTEELLATLIPEGDPDGLLAGPEDKEVIPHGSFIGDLGERILGGTAKLPGLSKKGSKLAEKFLLEAPGRLLAWEMKKLGINPTKADKAGEIAGKMGFGRFRPVQALKASNAVKELVDTKTDYYTNWEEKADKWIERSERYDKTITELWKAGDKRAAVGAAMLQGAESLPMSLMAAFGGPAGLASLGLYAGGEKYEQLIEEGVEENTALLNAMMTGTVESVSELGTAGLGYIIKGSIKKIGKEATEELVEAGLRGWFRRNYMKFGLWTAPVQEGAEEYINAVAENLIDKHTGVRPDAEISDGTWDAFWAGFAGGGYFMAGGGIAKGTGAVVEKQQKKKVEKQIEERKEAAVKAKEEAEKKKAEWVGGLKLRPEYVAKVKEERAELDDLLIKREQMRYNMPKTPDINIEDATDETLDAIDRGEPVMNDRLKAASDNLYAEYKALADMRESKDRKYTRDQIDEMMKVLEFEITLLNDRINEQAETGEFKTEQVELTDEVTVSTITEGVEGKSDEGVQPTPREETEPAEPAEPTRAETIEEAEERIVAEIEETEPAEPAEPTEVPEPVPAGDFGEPDKILTTGLKEANTRFVAREDAVAAEVAEILKDKGEIENRLNTEFRGRLNLEQKKERKELEARLAKMEREADVVFNKWQDDIAEFADKIRPTIESTIRDLDPNITDENLEKAMFYVWDDISRARSEEIDPEISIEDHITKVLAEEIYPEQAPAEPAPVEEEPTPEPVEPTPEPVITEGVPQKPEDVPELVTKQEYTALSLPDGYKTILVSGDEMRREVDPDFDGILTHLEKPYIAKDEIWVDVEKHPLGEETLRLVSDQYHRLTGTEPSYKKPEPKPEPPQDPDKLNDALVDRVRDYNKIPKSHTNKRQDAYGWILRTVNTLGYQIDQEKGDLVVKDKDGKKIRYVTRKTPQEEVDAHPALKDYEDQEFVDFVNIITDHPTFLMNYDVALDPKGIRQAIRNIKEGKKTVAANKLLDALEGSFNNGAMDFRKTATTPAASISIGDVMELTDDEALIKFHDEFGELGPDNAEEAVKAGLMTEQEKDNYLKSIEDEIKRAEEAAATEPSEERLDIGKDPGAKPGENTRERQRVTQEIEDQIADKEEQIAKLQKQKQKKFNELNQRKGLFGDTQTDPNAPAMFEETFEPTEENIQKALAPISAEIAALQKEIINLQKSKTTAGNEAAGQIEIPSQDQYADVVGKTFYIPSLSRVVKVIRVEDWTDPRDERVRELGGLFGETPAQFDKLTVGILEEPTSVRGGAKKAVILEKFRELIKTGKAEELPPYENEEYNQELAKLINLYRSIGDLDTAAKLEKKIGRDPTIGRFKFREDEEYTWQEEIEKLKKQALRAKKEHDITTGKIMFAPITPEVKTEEDLLNIIEDQVKRGKPLTPYIIQNTTKEERQKAVDIYNEHNKILAMLGFTTSSINEIRYLRNFFPGGGAFMAMYAIGSHQRALDTGRQNASPEKVKDSVEKFRREFDEYKAKHDLVRQRAFTWEIKNRFWKGERIADFRELTSIAKKWGITNKTTIRERAEVAMVEVARTIASDATLTSDEQFGRILEMYNSFPTLSYRTNEIKDKQQYSTPVPLAFLMGEYTNARDVDNVMDPSAGNGALLITANRGGVRANEIDPGRYQNLIEQGYRVFNVDSTHGIQRQLDVQDVDAVHINPPFGGTTEDFEGYWLHGEYVPVAHALKSMSPTGKAAIITGGHINFKPNGQMLGKDLAFFNWLNKNYHVEDVIQVPGDMYKTMGASYPIKLILVNGRKTQPKGAAPLQSEMFDPVETWSDIQARINNIKTEPHEANSLQREVDANRGDDSLVGGRETDQNPATERIGPDPTVSDETGTPPELGAAPSERVTSTERARLDPGTGRTRAASTDTRFSTIRKGDGGSDQTGRRGEIGRFGQVRPSRSILDLPTNNIGKPDQRSKRELGIEDISADDVTPYIPLSQGGSGRFIVPASIASEVQDALRQLSDEIGNVDDYVQSKLKYNSPEEMNDAFFAEQVDGVAQGIFNIESNNAMIIGHQTGTGKGRIAAGIIRYAIENDKFPVFITKGAELFTDIYRDMVNIGSPDYKPFIMNRYFPGGGKVKVYDKEGNVKWEVDPGENTRIIGTKDRPGTQTLPDGAKMLMTTYSQFNTEDRDANKRAFMERLAREKDVVFIMDESHEASGMSNTGEFFRPWLLSTTGGMFLSATYAKRPDSMPLYAMKTVLTETNMSLEELVDGILAGGTALQEIITHQLAESGQFSKIGFRMDAEMNYLMMGDTDASQPTYNPELGKKMVNDFDNVTYVLREIVRFQRDYINPVLEAMNEAIKGEGRQASTRRGTSEAGISNQPYFSRIWSIIDQMLVSMKVTPSIPLIIEDLKAGRKPVIGLRSTMESVFLNMERDGDLTRGETIPLDFSYVLRRGMDTVMKYTEVDEGGNKVKAVLGPENLTQAGRTRYYDLMEKIQKMSTGIPISPIDVLKRGITDAGFEVVEITGRDTMFEMNEDMTKGKWVGNDRGNKIAAVAKFNNNPGVAAILNQSGSTGISMHSSPDYKDISQRTMWTLQNDLNINTVVQLFGRIYRADQLNKPIYNILTSPLPAEKRMFMMNAKKLKSLDANTSGNQKQSKNMMDVPDFLNKYGDEMVYEYLKDNPNVNFLIEDPLNINGKEPNKQDAAHRVTGRIQILPSEMQDEFYKDVLDRYNAEIDYRNSTGTNDLMVTNEELDAEFIESNVDIEGYGGYSYFGDNTVLNKAEVNVTRKPFTKAQLQEQLDKVTDTHVEDMKRQMNEGVDKHLADQIREVQESSDQARDVWRNKIEDKEGLTPDEKAREYELKKNDIDQRENQRIDTLRSVAMLNKQKFNRFFDYFSVGRGLEIPFTEDEQLELVRVNKGVFLGFDVNMNKPNPWIPSNVMLKFATTDSRRMFRIPVSKSAHLDAIIGNSYHLTEAEKEAIIEDWDSLKRSRDRETRYIVTGNILQGINKFKKGRLIKFSMKDGSIERGILMPENWINQTDNIVRMPINRARETIMALPPRGFIEDFSGDIMIRKIEYPYYQLLVPSSTKRGNKYYNNDAIKNLVEDGLFEQINDRMVATFRQGNLQPLLDVLHENFKTTLEADNRQVQRGHDQTDAASMMEEWGAPAPTTAKNRGGLSNPYNETQGMIYKPTRDKKTGIERIPPSPIPPAPGMVPKQLWETQKDVSEALGKQITYTKRPSTRRAAGAYDPTTGKLGIMRPGDEDTAAHEIGHYLDDKFGLLGPKSYPIYDELKAELENFWPFGSKPPKNAPNPERYRMGEGMAEFIRAWLVNPNRAIKAAPTTYAWFKQNVSPNEKVWNGLVQFGNDIRIGYGSSAGQQLLSNVRLDPTKGDRKTNWRRENKEGQYRVTIFDRMGRRIWYFLDPLVESFKYGAKQQGITDIHDPKQLSPLQNFEIIARNHLGIDVKILNMIEDGIFTMDGIPVIDPVTKQRLSFNMMYEAIPGSTDAEYEANVIRNFEYGIAQRTVELPYKYQKRLLKTDLETTVDRLPPLDILAKHPDVIETYAGKINDIMQRIDEGKLDPDKVWIENKPKLDPKTGEVIKPARYDFTDITIIGSAKSGQRDYDLAVNTLKHYDEIVKENDPALYEGIKEFWRIYREISKQWSNYAYQAGLIDLETRNTIQTENLDYVAMNRLQAVSPEDMAEGRDLEFTAQKTPTGRGLHPREVVFPFLGSDKPVDNPVSSLIKSMMNVIDVGDMNYAVQTYADMFKRGAVGRNMHEGEPVKHGEIAWVSNKPDPGGMNISFFEKGKKMYLIFGNKYLYNNWKDLLPVNDNLGMKIASFMPQLLRRAITHSVRFVTRNMIRDTGQFLVVGEAKRYARPHFILPNREADKAFERYGGGQFGFAPKRKILGKEAIRESKLPQHQYMLRAKKAGRPETQYTMVGKGFRFAAKQFNLSERPTRRLQYMAAYNEGIKKYGLSHVEAATRAAFIARDLMDFAAAGTIARELNKVLIFSSAAVRGLEKIARTARKNPARFAAHVAAFSILPSIMNSMIMAFAPWVTDDEKEEYLAHPNYLRDGFYRIPNPFGRGWIIVPKPFELGRIGSIAQRGADKFLLGDEHAFGDGMWQSFFTAMNPYSVGGLTSGFSGFINWATNWDMFRQKHIIPPKEKDLAIVSRNTENASKFSRLIQEGSDAITWRQEDNPFIDARMLDAFLFSQFSTYAEYPIGAFEHLPIMGEANKRVAMDADVFGVWKDPQVYGSKHVQWLMDLYNRYPHLRTEGHYDLFQKSLDAYFDEGVQADNELKDEQGQILRDNALMIRNLLEAPAEGTGVPRDFNKEAAEIKATGQAKLKYR